VWARILALALVCACSPTAFLPPIVLLSGRRGPRTVVGYAAGQLGSNLVVAGLVYAGLAGSSSGHSGTTSAARIALELGAGIALVAYGFRTWARRDTPATTSQPGWMRFLDRMGPVTGFLFGAFWINTIFAADAGLEIARADVGQTEAALALVAYSIVASGASLAVLGVYVANRERAASRLAGIRDWMARNQRSALAIFLWVAGSYFLLKTGLAIVA